MIKLPHWEPSPEFIAQAAHFCCAGFIVLTFGLFTNALWGALAVICYAAPKEFLFDKYIEQQTFDDNLLDFLWWMAGMGTAVTLYIVRFVWMR